MRRTAWDCAGLDRALLLLNAARKCVAHCARWPGMDDFRRAVGRRRRRGPHVHGPTLYTMAKNSVITMWCGSFFTYTQARSSSSQRSRRQHAARANILPRIIIQPGVRVYCFIVGSLLLLLLGIYYWFREIGSFSSGSSRSRVSCICTDRFVCANLARVLHQVFACTKHVRCRRSATLTRMLLHSS